MRAIGPILVIIDALDAQLTEKDYILILPNTSLFRRISAFLPPRGWNIVDPLTKASKCSQIIRMDDSELSARTNEDIQVYLATVLPSGIYQKHGSSLAEKAGGLFQWVAVACEYTNDPPPGLTKNDCIRGVLGLSAPHKELGQKLGPL